MSTILYENVGLYVPEMVLILCVDSDALSISSEAAGILKVETI